MSSPPSLPPTTVIATILRHDDKQTSYKIALLRSINDAVLSFPDLSQQRLPVAIPLRFLAARWVAYYWPFVQPAAPIVQGVRAFRAGNWSQDISFRAALTRVREEWERLFPGSSGSSDGFLLAGEMRLPRKRDTYPEALRTAFDTAVKAIAAALRQPIQYAGPGVWTVFAKPERLARLGESVVALPGARPTDTCLVIEAGLWDAFRNLSLWVEALCLHEWCLFTERVTARTPEPLRRGAVFDLLTEQPVNRRPLTWERHEIDLLLLEGHAFTCPWSEKHLAWGSRYDLDHLVPLAVLPINEMWNLVPADPATNSRKGDRLPSLSRLQAAIPYLAHTYALYTTTDTLGAALRQDVFLRFPGLSKVQTPPEQSSIAAVEIADSVVDFAGQVANARNLPVFS